MSRPNLGLFVHTKMACPQHISVPHNLHIYDKQFPKLDSVLNFLLFVYISILLESALKTGLLESILKSGLHSGLNTDGTWTQQVL